MAEGFARRLRDEGLDPATWSNGSGDRYAAHDHGYDKVIVVDRGSIRFGHRLTAARGPGEEVVQETFLALWNRAESFDAAVGSLAAWLPTIARNRAIDRLRAAGRRPSLVALSSAAGSDEDQTQALERLVSGGSVIAGAEPPASPEAAFDAAGRQATIAGALAEMPEVERTVILLAYQEELSQSEIAERLGWPLGTVKTRTRRALLRLREALGTQFRPAGGLDITPGSARADRLKTRW